MNVSANITMIEAATAETISNVFVNNNCASVTLQITGSYTSATVLVEGLVNLSSNAWVSLGAIELGDFELNSDGLSEKSLYQIGIEGIPRVRIHVTAVSGGDITVVCQFGNAVIDPSADVTPANLTPITAYDMAVTGGYTGTKAQFETDMGNSATNATNAAASASEASASATTASNAAANFAPAYSSSAKYAVGDHVLYNGGYYVCNTAITTAEAWTAAHWTATTIQADLTEEEKQTALISNKKPFSIMSMGHRGYSVDAPENTLPAFRLAKQHGFDAVECDVRFTSDGVPVCLHDPSINRTARNADGTAISGTINIEDITYAQALTYDFGIWKNVIYAGTKIPTLEEYLELCRNLSIIPVLDTYGVNTQARAETVKNLIEKYGLNNHIWIVSSTYATLTYLSNVITEAYFGIVSWAETPTTAVTNAINNLMSKNVNVFLQIDNSLCDIPSYISLCENYGLALGVYSLNTENAIESASPFFFCITSDTLDAKKVLYDANIGDEHGLLS